MNKRALITGISGQDGAYLARFLMDKGYKVIGCDRKTARGSLWRLEELGIIDDLEITNFELTEYNNIHRTIEKYKPDEIYNLAAQSFVGSSWDIPIFTSNVTGLGVIHILEAIKALNPKIKFYQASSSEMFGKVSTPTQNENSPFYPRSPYAVAKLFGHWTTINYRESYDIFAVSGILFNHESPLRGPEFVTRKITLGLSKIKLGLQDYLELGNLEAKRDWGFAGDYIEGMWMMLQENEADDYVLATGEAHSIKEFIDISAEILDFQLIWKNSGMETIGVDENTGKTIVKINPKYFRPAEVELLCGESKKAREKLGWQPKVDFNDLVNMMTIADFKKCEKLV